MLKNDKIEINPKKKLRYFTLKSDIRLYRTYSKYVFYY